MLIYVYENAVEEQNPNGTTAGGKVKREEPRRWLYKNCVLLLLGSLFSVASGLYLMHLFLRSSSALVWISFFFNSLLFAVQVITFTRKCTNFENLFQFSDEMEVLHFVNN
ncbi:hypothetical protein niasHT_026603 [Heterodera trifolii]|uniref:Uncharacterized protein n=1 Tax=Heterodera trifolii TaxID=157864 RepID=A0ABD2KSF6_9BILA